MKKKNIILKKVIMFYYNEKRGNFLFSQLRHFYTLIKLNYISRFIFIL